MKIINYSLLLLSLIVTASLSLHAQGTKRSNENSQTEQQSQEKKLKKNQHKITESTGKKRKRILTPATQSTYDNEQIEALISQFKKLKITTALNKSLVNSKKRKDPEKNEDSSDQELLNAIMCEHPVVPFILERVAIERDYCEKSDQKLEWSRFLTVFMANSRYLVMSQGIIWDMQRSWKRIIQNSIGLEVNIGHNLIRTRTAKKNSYTKTILDIGKLYTLTYYLENQLTFKQSALLHEIYYEAIVNDCKIKLESDAKAIFDSLKIEVQHVLAPYIYAYA